MVGGSALGVCGGSVCGDLRVLALVIDFREVMLTSPFNLAHCTVGGGCRTPELILCSLATK